MKLHTLQYLSKLCLNITIVIIITHLNTVDSYAMTIIHYYTFQGENLRGIVNFSFMDGRNSTYVVLNCSVEPRLKFSWLATYNIPVLAGFAKYCLNTISWEFIVPYTH